MTAATQPIPRVADLVALLELTVGTAHHGGGVLPELPDGLWNEALLDPLREFLARPSKRFRARLVELGFRLAGGDKGALPPELGLIIESLHAGSLIVDDIEDDSELRRDAPCLHRQVGLPRALNAGNFLYFWPQVVLAQTPLPAAERLRAHERLAQCLMHCHQGQALDLSVRVEALAQPDVSKVVLAIGALKTGGLLGLATALGALAAGADPQAVDAIAAFGSALGVGLQMLDDMSGVQNPRRRAKAHEDLRHGRATFVWAWLSEKLEPRVYESLVRELAPLRSGGAPDALVERIRFRLGAFGACRARAHFARALECVGSAVGETPLLREFADELVKLERSYVEG